MSIAETATPVVPIDDEQQLQPTVIAPSPSDDGDAPEGGDASKSSPGLSPSTWKPNVEAAEWKPSFGAPAAPSPAIVQVDEESKGTKGERGEGKQDTDETLPALGADDDEAQPHANGSGPAGEEIGGAPKTNASAEAKEDGTTTEGAAAWNRYDIDFLLKLRPKPESTPKPAGLNPPDRVDILWDGKEAAPLKAGSSLRGGIRPLPPLGARTGSRGLGDARGAPPPLRGAQRDMGRDRDNRMESRGGGGREERRSGGGGGRDRGGGGGNRRVHVDTAPALEDCKPIEINEATRWKPKSLEVKSAGADGEAAAAAAAAKLPVEEVLMKANAILNKMTLEKFNKLSVKFMDVGLRDKQAVTGVIDMIVEKAQMEPHFSSMYADLCERIAHTPIACLGENPGTKDAGKGSKKFRKMLLIKCQDEFTKDWQGLFAAVQNDPDMADDEKAEKDFGLKRKYMGHMRFVGELYKVELLKEKHVQSTISELFGNADEPDEEKLECMTKLLQTCGKKLDSNGSPDTAKDMKRMFKRISKLADSRMVSSRIRFMLRDLAELRKNHWVPRREEEKAKTMQELHNDIAKEEESKNRNNPRGGGSSSRSGGGSSSSGLRPGSGDARVSSGSRPDSSYAAARPPAQPAAKAKDDDGWETVTKGGKGAGGDGWSQVPVSRSRSSNPGSDERRGGSGGSSLVAQQSAFALLSSRDEEKDKKKKKKESKEKKEKSSKSSKDKDKKKKKSSKSSSRPSTPSKSSGTAVSESTPSSPAATATAMTEESARKKGKEAAAEFSVSGELDEACTCLKEIDEGVRWAAVSEAVSDSMERKQKHRDALGDVLLAAAREGILSEEALAKGVKDVLEVVPDLCIDVPQAIQYVAAAVVPLGMAGHIDLGPLIASPCESLMEGGKAAEFAVVVISQVKKAAMAEGLDSEAATARASKLAGSSLTLEKLAAMLPVIFRGKEEKATALLERHHVTL